MNRDTWNRLAERRDPDVLQPGRRDAHKHDGTFEGMRACSGVSAALANTCRAGTDGTAVAGAA